VNLPEHRSRRPRASIRMDARLDTMTRAKLEGLATQFHRSRAAVLRQVMHWGLSREPSGQVNREATQGPVRRLFFIVESELYQQVRRAAGAAGGAIAPWLRHMLREITVVDFPASWRAGEASRQGSPEGHSHDSRAYGQRFMLRLDEPTWETLESLSKHFKKSSAEIIRQLVAQATPEAFSTSWRLAAVEHRLQDARPADRGTP
jgi:predicted transcriptional regulator